jgi:hypothetical protein
MPVPTLSIPPLPLPTLVPIPIATPAPPGTSITPGSTPSASPGASTGPDARPSADPSGPSLPGVVVLPANAGNGGLGRGGSAGQPPFVVGGSDGSTIDGLGGVDVAGFGGLIDWAVPSLVLSVPGLLVVLAVAAQAAGGVVWVPLARRWLGGFGVRRRDRREVATG